jgi:DNA recombination protein RmuC
MAGHFDKVGKSLDAAVRSYNDTVGSYEKRVLVSARKFGELGATAKDPIPEPEQIERAARAVVGDTGQLTFEENETTR